MGLLGLLLMVVEVYFPKILEVYPAVKESQVEQWERLVEDLKVM